MQIQGLHSHSGPKFLLVHTACELSMAVGCNTPADLSTWETPGQQGWQSGWKSESGSPSCLPLQTVCMTVSVALLVWELWP